MKFCSKCGKEIFDEAVVCPNCGCATAEAPKKNPLNNVADEVSIGLCVLSALIPLFGVIYWPVKHKETPKKAQACGIAAIVAWVLYMAIFYISML